MGVPGFGKRKKFREGRVYVGGGTERRCSCLFLDSGAHSLYNRHVFPKPKGRYRHDWYADEHTGKLTKQYRKYLDGYADFINAHKDGIDYYATVDAIYSPEVSYTSLKYLEAKGLTPVPVIHRGTDVEWVKKYVKEGYTLVGLGGLGQESTRKDYVAWADQVFLAVCPKSSGHMPLIRAHGFAMTSYAIITRYPWWSVDSVSWAKSAGFGTIFVPHKRGGKFVFDRPPYVIGMSFDSPSRAKKDGHYWSLSPSKQDLVLEWLDVVGVPLGSVVEDDRSPNFSKTVTFGVLSEYNARAMANARFFEKMCEWLPKWPYAWTPPKRSRAMFHSEDS